MKRRRTAKEETVSDDLNVDAPVRRDFELAALWQSVNSTIQEGKSCSMYLSGPPGTGKTACAKYIIRKIEVCLESVCYVFNPLFLSV